MPRRPPRDDRHALLALKAQVLKAIAQPLRLALLEALRDGERCVCNLTELVGAQRSNVSRHLAVMAAAGVVASRKQGTMTFYRLRTPCLTQVLGCLEAALRSRVEEQRALLLRA